MRSATQSVWYHSRGIGLMPRLGRAGFTTGLGREQRREALGRVDAVRVDRAICRSAAACACRRAGTCIASSACSKPRYGPVRPSLRHAFSGHWSSQVEARLEVRLPEQRGAVARCVAQVLGDARRVVGQRHAVRDDAVRAHVLAGEHRRARRHAHGVLVVRALVVDTVRAPARRPPACARSCRRCNRASRSAAGRS